MLRIQTATNLPHTPPSPKHPQGTEVGLEGRTTRSLARWKGKVFPQRAMVTQCSPSPGGNNNKAKFGSGELVCMAQLISLLQNTSCKVSRSKWESHKPETLAT